MLQESVTISMALVNGLLDGVRDRGRAFAEALTEAGIAPELLALPGARVTAMQYTTLCQALIRQLDDEVVGLLSRPLKRGSLALIARSALHAPSLEAAMHRIAKAMRLLQDDFELQVVRDGGLGGLASRAAAAPPPASVCAPTCGRPARDGPISRKPPRRCTWRPRPCSDTWPAKVPRSRR